MKNYKEYKQFVIDNIINNNWNEIEEKGLIIWEQVRYTNGEYARESAYRLLTEQEFNERFKD